MKDPYHIEDWEGYDKTKHIYVITTDSGKDWNADGPIFATIAKYIGALTDGVHNSVDHMHYMDWANWLKSIRVECQGRTVAVFDLNNWKWRTLSRGTKPGFPERLKGD